MGRSLNLAVFNTKCQMNERREKFSAVQFSDRSIDGSHDGSGQSVRHLRLRRRTNKSDAIYSHGLYGNLVIGIIIAENLI